MVTVCMVYLWHASVKCVKKKFHAIHVRLACKSIGESDILCFRRNSVPPTCMMLKQGPFNIDCSQSLLFSKARLPRALCVTGGHLGCNECQIYLSGWARWGNQHGRLPSLMMFSEYEWRLMRAAFIRHGH